MFSCHGHTCHSNYRLRDSIIRVPDFITRHKELNFSGCVLTEHESLGSHLEAEKFFEKLKDTPEYEGFKVGFGNEIYLCPDYVTAENVGHNIYPHFILIALDALGHKALRELSTIAWTKNSFYSMMYRVPTYYSDLEEILDKYKGHLIGSSACFVKDTPIETKQGWKKIQEINANDYVKNMYGDWEKVNFPTSRVYNDIGYEIEVYGNYEKISCTKDHQFLTITHNRKKVQWVKAEDLTIKKGASKDIFLYPCKNEYHESEYINKTEFSGKLFPLTVYSNRRYSLPETIKITPELMRLFGFYLGDGHTSLSQNFVIGFTVNEAHFQYFYNDFLKPVEEQLKIKWYINKRENAHRVDVSSASRELVELFYYLFNNEKADFKKIPSRLRISKELDYELIFGYMLADGYFRIREGNKKVKYSTGEFITASISKQLSTQIHNILYDLGIPNSITLAKGYTSLDGVNHKDAWYITGSNYTLGQLKKEKNYSHNDVIKIFEDAINERRKYYIKINDTTYKKIYIKNVNKIHINENVYCLNNDSHSFKCQDVVVHNCLGGSIPRKLLEHRSIENINVIQAETLWKQIKEWIEYMVEIFGKGYFFLEMQPNSHEDQIYVNKCLYKLSQETNVPFIITFDEHYLKKEDRDIHRAYLKASDGDREVDEFYASTYIMTEEEVHEYMDDYLGSDVVQQGMDNTMLIYDKMQYYSLKKELQIPYLPFDLSEPDEDLFNKYKDKIELLDYFYHSEYPSDRHMTRELLKSLEKNTHYQCQRGYDAIQECLSSIKISSEANKVRWSAYLMQVKDYVNIAWESDSIVAPSRGSGGGFCLLYLLDIIQLDPLRENTKMYPWRFLNPERVSVLDIDTDVEAAKRESIIRKIKETYGYDRVSKVCTLQTEKSRSAILTAARALDIDNDTASYIASLVVFDRGQPRDLHTMYYGNEDYAPVFEFVREMDARPELWEVSQKIEGLISGIGSHAGGVIIDDKPLTESTALMRTNSGDIITQFNLHDCEDAGLIKIDLLATDALNFIHATLNLLLKDNEIEWQGSLKKTYDKYLGIYNIDRAAPKMWDMIADHKVINLFQMEAQSGRQALALVKPHSVDDLATINSVIRLMAQEKGAETPLEKYARFHDNIQLWYDEMTEYGLTDEEQNILKDILGISCGICEAQEYLILLTMHPKIGGFSLKWSDQLRKAVAKKSPKDFDKLEKEFFQNMKDKNLSENLCKYVWYVLIYTQRGYGLRQ